MSASGYNTITAYHEATKHHFHRYARSAGFMDWANQPNPFRYYDGADKIRLPIFEKDPHLSYDALYSPLVEAGQPLSAKSLSLFLSLSMGLSAWKKVGDSQWALRINPSSGNLHPTEAHLVVPLAPGINGGIFHYFSFEHALELRSNLPEGLWQHMASHFGGPGFLIALSTIYWRESWKYGERAFRYCNLDAGHALAALSMAARLLNWELTILTGAGDDQVTTLLGFDQTPWHSLEQEVPELICWVSLDATAGTVPQSLPQNLVLAFKDLQFNGNPNPLSRKPVNWSIISDVSSAARKAETTPGDTALNTVPRGALVSSKNTAAKIMRQRRSAVMYDPKKEISSEVFQSMLNRTLSRQGVVPFGVRLMVPNVHLLLFVHRVAELVPGLYVLVRRQRSMEKMQSLWRKEFLWQLVWPDFPLYRLKEQDVTLDAMELSCHQEIAGESAFAVAMIARFDDVLRREPYKYRHLHWECGMIGQVLYLEAEAHGIRGTGIGCFFDDPVHQLIGVMDSTYQSLYHFTVGHPIEDTRLQTLPPYHHIDPSKR